VIGFCKPASSKKRFIPRRKIDDRFYFTIYEKAADIKPYEWKSCVKDNHPFMQPEFLGLIEKSENVTLTPRYICVYNHETICGIIYYQIIDFQANVFGEILTSQLESLRAKRMGLFEKYIDHKKEDIILRLLTCGNNLVSGQFAYRFTTEISDETRAELLTKLTVLLGKEEKLRSTISATMIKDFESDVSYSEIIEAENFTPFLVEPNLVVQLPANCLNVEEYIQTFSKKYRNRAKSILRKGNDVIQKQLSLEELRQYEQKIFSLYENIYNRAKFKLLKLPNNYFTEVKKLYPDIFSVKGFFLKDELVAFASSFLLPNNILEVHYIGLDYHLNLEFELYQNILYSMLAEAFENKIYTVNLGRTAAEIKTTIGAKPHDLLCYIKPQNGISKLILKPFISFLQPSPWVPRYPFKEGIGTPTSNHDVN
jgi:hypothetical protein